MIVKNKPACFSTKLSTRPQGRPVLLVLLIVLSAPLTLMQSTNATESSDNSAITVTDTYREPIKIDITRSDKLLENTDKKLNQIITSDRYAKSREKTEWQHIESTEDEAKEDAWWKKLIKGFFDFLFGHKDVGSSNPLIDILPFIIKLALVLALVFFIAWVVRQAIRNAWFTSISRSFRKKVTVSNLASTEPYQSWENLPEHSLIPQVVQDLIARHDYEQAASVLYRGSLRWLNQTQDVSISPATTEKQCLNQIEHISTMSKNANPLVKDATNKTPKRKLSATTIDYLSKLIFLWVEVAYAQNISFEPSESNSSQRLQSQLLELSKQWLATLPLGREATASVSVQNQRQGDL